MGERLAATFPFLIAVILPPAGLLMGLSQLERDREIAKRLIVVSLLAVLVWVLVILAL